MTTRDATAPKKGPEEKKSRPKIEARTWKDSSQAKLSLLAARYENQRFTAHTHDTFVIGTNIRGRASCFDRSDRIFGPGSLVVIPPGELHSGHRVGGEPWEYLAIYPSCDFLQGLLREVTGRDAVQPSFTRLFYPDPDLVRGFVHAHRTCLSGADPLAGESAMVEILGLLLKRHGVNPSQKSSTRGAVYDPDRKRAIARSLEFMRASLAEPLTLEALAFSL